VEFLKTINTTALCNFDGIVLPITVKGLIQDVHMKCEQLLWQHELWTKRHRIEK